MPFDRRRHHRDDLAGTKFVPLRHGTRFGNGIRLSISDDSVTAPDFTTTMLQSISKCRRRSQSMFRCMSVTVNYVHPAFSRRLEAPGLGPRTDNFVHFGGLTDIETVQALCEVSRTKIAQEIHSGRENEDRHYYGETAHQRHLTRLSHL